VIGDLAIKQFPELVQPKAEMFYNEIGALVNPLILPIILQIDTDHEQPIDVRAQNILDQAPGLDAFDGGIYFLDRQGTVIKTHPAQPEMIGQDWSDTPHFRSVHATPNLGAFTDLISLGSSGQKILCVAMAMSGQTWDEVLGVMYYCYTVYPAAQNAYYQKMSSLGLGSNFTVVDRNNQVIFSPDPAEMGKDLSGEAFIQQLSQGESAAGRFRIGAEDVVVSYVPVITAPIDRIRWYVVTEQSWSEIMQPSLLYRQLLYLLLALGVIVPALVTAYGVRHITEPIQKLIQASEQVTAGQFEQRIEVKTGDEIETLADQFNLMSAELAESYASLEKKVADRTRELAILNSIISVASHSLNLQEILEDALQTTVKQMGFNAGVAFKLQPAPNTGAPLLVAHCGFVPATAVELMSGYALASQETLPEYPGEVRTLSVESFQDEKLKSELSRLDFQLLVYIPLSTKGRQLGFFIMGRHEPDRPSPEELSLFGSIGRQIGVAMENARLYEQAEGAAIAAERNRLARELHDAVTQTLFSASLVADVLPGIWKRNPQEGMQNLEELRQLTRGALAEMRTLLLEMRPESIERVGLKTLLTQLVDAFVGRVRIPLDLDIHGDCQLTHEVKVVFYRVAQEALNNIARHSGARQVELRLDCQPGQMSLLIKDDGLGFDPGSIGPDHLGIAIMRERASSIGASLQVDSQLGQGTTITLDWNSTRRG
jgi:nitrate/nitrite-specific signal transduction histidine kinase